MWIADARSRDERELEVFHFVPGHTSGRASGMGGHGSMDEGVTADRDGSVYGGEVGPIQGTTAKSILWLTRR